MLARSAQRRFSKYLALEKKFDEVIVCLYYYYFFGFFVILTYFFLGIRCAGMNSAYQAMFRDNCEQCANEYSQVSIRFVVVVVVVVF